MKKTFDTANYIIKDKDDIVKKIHSLTEAEAKAVMSTFGKTGSSLNSALNNLNPCGRALYNVLNKTAKSVPGSRIVSPTYETCHTCC